MPEHSVVLVVGTTPDYIDWIRQGLPRKALFLTDPDLRKNASEPVPEPSEEILCDLSDDIRVLKKLNAHLQLHHLNLSGIACYDCESMPLTAIIARHIGLSYCSPESILKCQNKYLSKRAWLQNNVLTPQSQRIGSEVELVDFFNQIKKPCVVKPQNGTGSELVFLCATEAQCRMNFREMEKNFKKKSDYLLSPEKYMVVAEEFIEGEEYSCDFIIKEEQIHIIRVCKKIISKNSPMGTAQAYVLMPAETLTVDLRQLKSGLYQAVSALDITDALCMADFIIKKDSIYFLELTPRPGGDCLPYLLKYAWGLDMLLLNLEYARKKEIHWQAPAQGHQYVGLRLHARRSGILKKIHLNNLKEDPHIGEVFIKRKPGHCILLPPDDYDSWVLGHILFEAQTHMDVEIQCHQILDKIDIQVE